MWPFTKLNWDPPGRYVIVVFWLMLGVLIGTFLSHN